MIIPKRKVIVRQPEKAPETTMPVQRDEPDSEPPAILPLSDNSDDADAIPIDIRDTPYRAKDQVFSGREVQKPKTAPARDTPLIHTRLKPKKSSPEQSAERGMEPDADQYDTDEQPDAPRKKPEKKGRKQDDMSWI